MNELRLAARALLKRPGYAAIAAFTLALGIGANVAIFTVVNAVLLRPLPYPDADRIITINHHAPGMNLPSLQSSPGLILRYRETARTLTRMAGYDSRKRNLTGSGNPERVRALAVTPEFFDVMAMRPALGRPFREADAQQKAPLVTILTHALWQSRFGSNPAIVGQRLKLDGEDAEIVGIMPPRFAFPDPETRILIPLWLDPKSGFGAFGVSALARLAPGVTFDAARRELEQLQGRIPEWYPDLTSDLLRRFGWSVTMQPLRESIVSEVSKALWILLGTVGLVLLVAGANVANLFLVRAESRQREVAVRSALGASRARIARTFLAESLLLACAGGAAGLLLAAAGIRLLVANGPAELPRLHEVSVDATVVAFTAALTLLAASVLGAMPMLRFGRLPFATLIRDGGRGVTGGGRHRVRQLLIVGQVAAALVLLVASGLMLKSAARLYAVDAGFKLDGLIIAGVSLGEEADRARASTFYRRVLEEAGSLPGVTSVGAASSEPVAATSMNGGGIDIASRPRAKDAIPLVAMYTAVTPRYFETLGVRLLQGRAPTWIDVEQNRPVVWVNESLARSFLDNRALGERIKFRDTWLEIVGIVGNVRTFGLREDPRPLAYIPLTNPMATLDVMYLVLRTGNAPASLASSLRAAVNRVNPSVPLMTVRTMEETVSGSLAQMSFTMTLLAIAAGVALVLGVVGLYGVIGFIVAQRTAEIGVRIAIGAQPRDVRRMVLRQGVGVALVGVGVGLLAAAAVTGVMASLLYEVSARDPIIFGVVALVLVTVSALATYLPARRAARIDPLHALREVN